ncbi:butyrophilin subfamily 3 member A2-like [Solea senegalensis]|uniref:Butyrophilin subfamily 3 member A2-like n=1 Tax=Solea senegalensis TaxID=28829 RepID=A0AAV6QTJ1_SOLSE|nr:butyrophilin subfamily 3 member A2-like [Solea senegalensis]
MYYSLLLASALLFFCTPSGESTESGSPQNLHGPVKIRVLTGSFAVLPCAFNTTSSPGFPTAVEWSKKDLKDDIVFLYRDGRETHELKNPAFEYRTNFILKVPKYGNVSLRISDVRLSDAGTYLCKKLWKSSLRDITTVELEVAAVSEPRLSVVSGGRAGVTVQCEVGCWLPEPEIRLLDDRGNELPAENKEKGEKTAVGCYTVKRRVTLQDATSSVRCEVWESQFNQSKDTKINLPDNCLASSVLLLIIGWTLFGILACAVCVVCLWKKFCKSGNERKLPVIRHSSSESIVIGKSEKQSLLEQNHIVDLLTKENEKLKSELQKANNRLQRRDKPQRGLADKQKVVCQQDQPTVNSSTPCDKRPTLPNQPPCMRSKPAVQRQNSNPGPPRPIQTTRRNISSPDLYSGNTAASSVSPSRGVTAQSKRHRSMSEGFSSRDSYPRRPQRRQSFGTSVLSNNPYGPLDKLNEESDG